MKWIGDLDTIELWLMTDDPKLPSTPVFIHKFLLLTDFPLPQNQDSCYFFASHEFGSTDSWIYSSIFQLNGELTESGRGEICSTNIWPVDYGWWWYWWWWWEMGWREWKKVMREREREREREMSSYGWQLNEQKNYFIVFYFKKTNLLSHTFNCCISFSLGSI